MPLHVGRLRDSSLAISASGDEFRAAVILWCVAWHQAPAASLPDDDRVLAAYVGYARDPDGWAKVREGALRGFQLCSDGRLYHSVLAVCAIEAWDSKMRSRYGRECDRLKKAAYRAKADAVIPSFDEWKQYVALTGSDKFVPRMSDGRPEDIPGTSLGNPLLREEKGREGNRREEELCSSSVPHSKHASVNIAARACALMEDAGAKKTNPSSPDLAAAIAEGISAEVLADTVREAIKADKTNPFAWAITAARRRHAEGPKPINGKRASTEAATPSAPKPREIRQPASPEKVGAFLQGIKEFFGAKLPPAAEPEVTHDPL